MAAKKDFAAAENAVEDAECKSDAGLEYSLHVGCSLDRFYILTE